MATKRQPAAKGVTLLGFGEIKMSEGGITLQGFANKAVVDRGNEIIATDAWDLENYKKNPVILYNHGFDPQLGSTPVGAATEVTPTEDGLFIKCRLSGIDDPLINRIRGLVKEKILRAFSVGFNPITANDDPKTGVKTITKAELFEVSIVGVPMNQDSLFEVTGKMLKSMSADALRADILKRKGAWVAAAVQNTMFEKQKKEKLKRDDMLAAILDKAEIDEETLTDILAGNVTPVPENVLAAFSEVLGISMDDLKKLDAGDVEVGSEEAKPDEEPGEEEKPEGEAEAGEGPGAEAAAEADPKRDDEKEKADGGAAPTDFQKCVGDKIRKLMADGKEQDVAVAEAISACSEGEGAKCQKPTKKDYALWFKLADSLHKQADQGHDAGVTVEISSDKTEAAQNDFGSPMLEAQKQTNVLLGQLIAETQKLSVKLDGLQSQPSKEGTAASDGGAGDGKAGDPPPAVTEESSDEKPATEKPAEEKPESDGTPKEGMSDDELKAALEARSKKYGIEALEGGELMFPEGGPAEVEKYGDPVNLKYPVDSAETSDKARADFKKEAKAYKKDESKALVHARIVNAQIALEGDASYDEKDPLDALLPKELKDKLVESIAKALNAYRKRLEDVKKRLVAVGA